VRRRIGPGLAGLLAVLAVAAPPAAHGGELEDALAKRQHRYETTRTMRAHFEQTVESPTLAGSLEASGTVLFQKPNEMRWTYDEPDPQVIVGDGTDLWIYQPDLQQVIRTPLSKAFQSRTPLTFLAGLGSVERDFDARLIGQTDDTWELQLDPKGDAELGLLVIALRKRDASIAEARVTDPVGTTTRLHFTDEERNVAIDPAEFRFVPPDGVDVVRPPTY
jgi:outer membrane lipoprotein carrier protein